MPLHNIPPIYGFRAHLNGTNQTGIADNVETQVQFTTKVFDQGGFYSTSTYRWTPPAGIVVVCAQLLIQGATYAAGTAVAGLLRKNGTGIVEGVIVGSTANALICCPIAAVDQANGTDYYDISVLFDVTSGTYSINGNSLNSWFSAYVLQPF